VKNENDLHNHALAKDMTVHHEARALNEDNKRLVKKLLSDYSYFTPTK
jgi:predicted hydrolase (HD superfamily)